MSKRAKFRAILIALAVGMLPLQLAAQELNISGTVIDAGGEPVVGASVVVKGTTTGVITDANGSYNVSAAADAVLQFSMVGMGDMEEAVGGRGRIDVTLAASAQDIDDVVVVGYGTVRKRDLTGAVSSVKGDQLTSFPVSTPVEALQGRVAGADITKSNGYAGQGVTIRIRGNRSVMNPGSSNNPLYIVDGVQGVDINDINAQDILSMEVLKDASSTAIYGSRGANGVIIITTKKGTVSRPKINLSSYFGISNVAGYGDFMNADQYIAFRREQYRAAGQWSGPADDAKAFTADELAAIAAGTDNNWPELSLHQGFQQDHVLSMTAGTENTKVYISGNVFDEKGILKNDSYRRYSGRMSLDQKVYSWLDAGMTMQLAYSDNHKRRDPFNVSSKVSPITPIYDANGNMTTINTAFTNEINPLLDESLDNYNQQVLGSRVSGSAYLDVKPIKDLSIRSTFGATLNNSTDGRYYSKTSIDGKNANANINQTRTDSRFITWESVATYSKTIGDHAFTLTGVAGMNKYVTSNLWASARNPVLPAQLWYTMASTENQSKGGGYSEYALASFAGRVNYSFKDKYVFNATIRTDGSSKLGGKWANFPSVGAGWIISDEAFMESLKSTARLSNLKLRASWGKSGNDAVSAYATQMSLAGVTNFSYDGSTIPSSYTLGAKMGNVDLGWETTSSFDLGLELGFFDERLTMTLDYYDAKTNNLLFNFLLAPTIGLGSTGSIDRNFGKTRNRGVEILLSSKNIVKKNFYWATTLTFSKNNEEIVSLPEGKNYYRSNDARDSRIIGQPSQVWYSWINDGIWQENEADAAAVYGAIPGDLKLRDFSGPDGVADGKVDDFDRTVIGKVAPDFYGSISNDFKFYGFDLSIYMTYRVGSWISSDYYGKWNRNGKNNNAVIDYWTPENTGATFPRPNVNRPLPGQHLQMLTLAENSFFKVKNIVLGYTLPAKFTQKFAVQNLRVWGSVKNAIIFSQADSAFDPELEGMIDHPLNKLVTFGVTIGL